MASSNSAVWSEESHPGSSTVAWADSMIARIRATVGSGNLKAWPSGRLRHWLSRNEAASELAAFSG